MLLPRDGESDSLSDQSVLDEEFTALEDDRDWLRFSGVKAYHQLPLAVCLLSSMLVGLGYFRSPGLFKEVRDVSFYILECVGCAVALVVLSLNSRVINSPTLKELRRSLETENFGVSPWLELFVRHGGAIARRIAFMPLLHAASWWCRLALRPDVPFHRLTWDDVQWWLDAMYIMGCVGRLLMILYVAVVFLSIPVCVSRSAVEAVVKKIEKAGPDFDWDMLFVEVHDLDRQLEELWSLSDTGLQWVLVFGVGLCACLYGAQTFLNAMIVASGDPYHYSVSEVMFCPMAVIACAGMLYALSTVNTMCQGQGASPKVCRSILSSARRFLAREGSGKGKLMVQIMTEEQRNAHHRFVTYLAGNTMGVQLCGILVTPQWVISMVAQLGVAMPIVYEGLRMMASRARMTSQPL